MAYGVKTLIVESSTVPRTLVRARARVRVRVRFRVRVRLKVRLRVRVRVSVSVRVRVHGAPHHSDLLQPRGVELGACAARTLAITKRRAGRWLGLHPNPRC